jgi:hypothetical protein
VKKPVLEYSSWPWSIGRRDFLRAMSSSFALSAFARFARALPQPLYPFEEISFQFERHNLESYCRPLSAKVSTRNNWRWMRFPRL